MDALVTARYGLLAAERRFEASAVKIATVRADENLDLAEQVVEMVQAKHQFSANLTVIRFAQEMWDTLLELQKR